MPTETSDSDLGFVAQDDDIGFKPEPAGDGIGFRPADDGADLGFREEAQSTPLLEKPAALANALVTGVKQALVNIDVLQANRLGSAAPPSYRSQRAAFESAAADPRGMATSRVDPLSGELNLGAGEGLFGPAAKLEEIQRPAQLEREATQFDVARGLEGLRSRPVSPTMQRFNAVPNNDVLGLAREVARNPVEVLGSIALQSLPASLMGLPAGPAGIGASSAATEFANTLVDQAGEMGFDLTDPRDVARFFADPRALSRAREAAALRAIPIGVFDAMTARLAGRWMEPAMGKGAKAVVGAGAKELAMQMAGGAAGEAAGQAMSGQDWSAKDIIMEALGELGGAPFEIASNLSEDKAHRSPGASAGPSNRIEVQAEPTPATVEAGPVGDDISFAPDEPAKSAGPADGGSGVLDTVDWADVGRVPVHRAMEEETVDGFVSRRSAMQKVAGRANAWGVEDPDVRWAPELRAPGGGMVEAWVDPGTGRVVLNAAAPRLQDDSSAGPIVREEIAHQQLMSDEGVAAVREFASQFLTPDVVAQIEGAGYVRPEGWSDRRWMDYLSNEFIAKAAAKDTPFWKEIVERVKVWVHQVTGGRVSLTSEEAARALMRSVRAGRRGSEVSAAGLQEAPQASVRKQAFPQLSLGLDVLDGKERLPEGVKPKIINIAEWFQSRVPEADRINHKTATPEQLHERLVGRPSRIAADAAGRVGRIGRSRDQQPGGSPVGAPVEGAALPQLSVEGPPEGDATRRFARQIDASSDISGEVRDQTNPKAFYTPRRNETDAAFASRIVDQVGGPEAAIAVFRDRQSGLPEAVRGFVAQSIIKKLGELEQVAALSDAARSSQLAGIAARFITDDVFPATTSAGQFVQSFAAFSRLTPAGMIGVYRLTMNRVSGNVRDRLSGTVERIAKGLRKVNADGIGELAGDRAAQQAATSAIDASVPSSPAVRQAIVVQVAGGIGASPVVMRQAALAVQRAFQAPAAKAAASGTLWSRYVAEAVNSLASSADAGGGRGAKALVGELTDAIVSTLREQVQRQFPKHEPGSPPSGLTPVQRMASVLANPGPAREIWLRTVMALRERFPNDPRVEALSLEPAALFSRDIVRAAVKAELEGFGLSVRDIVAGHYTLLNEGQTLADRLASGTGIATVHAQELARVIDELFRSESAKLKAAVPAKVKDQRSRLKRAAQSGVVDMASVPIDEVDQAIRSELTRMRTSVSQVLKDHYTTLEGTGRTLAEGFVAGAGLNAEVAKHLAGVIQSRFRSLLADRRRAEIIRHADAAPRAYRKRMPIEELAQLAALGILNEEQVWNAMREKLALPGFDPRVAGDITRMANALQKLPEGVRRDEAAIDIMRFIARQRGQRASDLPVAFWYANMLSGTLTHLINSVSNATQIVAHATTAAARRPGSVPLLLEATVDGVLGGINEAARVMQTGKVTGARAGIKLGPGNALETLGTDAAWKRLVEKWKYVSRALGAADMLFYRTAEAQRVAVLGKAVAAEEGLTGAAAETRAREILYGTEDLRAQAAERVALEGLTGTLAEKRRRELVAAGRPGQINENAHAYALRVVFNDQPYGVLGIVGSSIKYLAARLPATRLLVPFVDVVCNVTNEALNYTPVGLVRGAQGRWLGEMNGRQIDLATEAGRQDLFDQWSKAAVGTGAVLGLALMASGDLDKEDPDFAIYGAGPGDQAKTQLLRARGWRPWSVKVGEHYVPYADTPLAIGLAVAGSYMDALRWQKMDQASALDRVAIALMAAPRVTVQKSFLRGLSDFFVALSRQSSPAKAGEKGMQVAAGVASGFVVPNLLREVDRVFDPTVTDNRSVEGLLANQIPFVRRLGRPALTPLGDPVQANPLDRLWSNSTRDRLVRLLADKGAWVSLPDQGDLTDDEYYDVVKARGEMLRPMLESMEPTLDAADRDLARRIVSRISEATSKAARAEVLSKRPQ